MTRAGAKAKRGFQRPEGRQKAFARGIGSFPCPILGGGISRRHRRHGGMTGTGNRGQETGDRKQGTGNRGQETGNRRGPMLNGWRKQKSEVRSQRSEEGFARAAFCSGTPPRSDRGCGGLRAPLPIGAGSLAATKGECIAAKYFVAERLRVPTAGRWAAGAAPDRRGKPRRYKKGGCRAATDFVAERLRVPTGGAAGCGAHSRSAREAAPLQKGERIVAQRPNPQIHDFLLLPAPSARLT